jgi:hypothetical protein
VGGNLFTNQDQIKVGEIQERESEEKTSEPIEKEPCVGEACIPMQLFDIKLELEDSSIKSLSELVAIVTFESFGTEPTPVNLSFTIFEENNIEVYTEKEDVTVETERVLRNEFKDFDLPTGKYTLILTTLYDVDVIDEFSQEFEIMAEEVRDLSFELLIFLEIALIALVLVIIYFGVRILKKQREKIKQNGND